MCNNSNKYSNGQLVIIITGNTEADTGIIIGGAQSDTGILYKIRALPEKPEEDWKYYTLPEKQLIGYDEGR